MFEKSFYLIANNSSVQCFTPMSWKLNNLRVTKCKKSHKKCQRLHNGLKLRCEIKQNVIKTFKIISVEILHGKFTNPFYYSDGLKNNHIIPLGRLRFLSLSLSLSLPLNFFWVPASGSRREAHVPRTKFSSWQEAKPTIRPQNICIVNYTHRIFRNDWLIFSNLLYYRRKCAGYPADELQVLSCFNSMFLLAKEVRWKNRLFWLDDWLVTWLPDVQCWKRIFPRDC